MRFELKDMSKDISKVVLGGLAFAVIAYIIHNIGAMLTMNYYLLEEFFPVWSKLMMPTTGAPPIQFMLASFAFSLISGILFAGVYLTVINYMGQRNEIKTGALFGVIVFLVSTIPGSLSIYLLINLPLPLIVAWTLEYLMIYPLCGAVVAAIDSKI